MKTCFKCLETKDRTEFYKHPRMADGLLGKCKSCAKKDSVAWYHANLAHRNQYERTAERRAGRIESHRRGAKFNPEKYRARSKFAGALRRGAIVRPASCSVCGVACKPQAHHHDYSKPLDVQWMCFRCHREVGHGQTVTHGPCAAT